MEPMTALNEECEIDGMWLTTLIGSNNYNTIALKVADFIIIFVYYHKIPACHMQRHYLLKYPSKKIRSQLRFHANCHLHKHTCQFHKNVNLTNRISVFPGAD
jgi:hypothetical protein